MDLRIINLNIGATIKKPGGEVTDAEDAVTNLKGLSDFFKRKAAEVNKMAIGIQEIENYIKRSAGINQPWYFDDKMGTGWTNKFQKLLPPDNGKLKIYDGANDGDDLGSYRNGVNNPGFGNALVSNVPVIKTIDHRFSYNPDSKRIGAEDVFPYGKQQKGALAVKLGFEGKYMWLITTHFALELHAIERQVWQILGLVGSMDPYIPVVVMGDMNVWQNGINEYEDETITSQLKDRHRILYHKVCTMLEAAGFIHLGEHAGRSFKPWNLKSRIDYCFLLNPAQYASSTLTLNKFEIELPRNKATDGERPEDIKYYTDHCALVMDFSWL